MVTWAEVEEAAPELAALVRQSFVGRKHATMATLRKDGSPRISGTEVDFADGQVVLGSMLGARKARDLQRDPRVAVHSPTVDPPEDDPSAWPGEAKLAGTVSEVLQEDSHRFVVDIAEIVHTKVEADQLVVRWWAPESGEQVARRT
jgi:hypothetical protein